MNADRRLFRRKKKRQHPGHGHPRITHADENFFRGRECFRHKNGRGLAFFGGGEMGFLFGKGQIAGTGAIGGREAGELDRAVAEDFTPKLFCNLSSSDRHRTMI